MRSPEGERRFYEVIAPAERRRCLTAGLLGVVFVPLFSILDAIAYPAELRVLLLVRTAATGVLLAATAWIYMAKTYRPIALASAVGVVSTGAAISALTHMTGGAKSPYYAGMSLVFITAGALMTWDLSTTIASFGAVLVSYFLPFCLLSAPIDSTNLLIHAFFLVCTAVIAAVSIRIRLLLAQKAVLLRSGMRVVGDYLLHDRIGGGGQGEVYVAEEVRTGSIAAVKVLTQTEDVIARKRLEREGDVLARLKAHPNVVRLLGRGCQDGHSYLALELLEGSDLRKLLHRHGQLPSGSVVDIGWGIAHALTAVHEAGWVHHDIKCDNVIVLAQGRSLRDRVRLIDFGTAFDPDRDGREGFVGTLPYMAPELLRGEPPTRESDIYAVGVVLFRIATGQPPYHATTPAEQLRAILRGPTPHASDRMAGIPPALDCIIARAMARDPKERFPTAKLLEEALHRVSVLPSALLVSGELRDIDLRVTRSMAESLPVEVE